MMMLFSVAKVANPHTSFSNIKVWIQSVFLEGNSTLLLILLLLCILMMFTLGVLLKKQNYKVKMLRNERADSKLQIQSILLERDWLLKEINHRVKNNLQIMISLLNSQEFFLNCGAGQKAIKKSQHRLHAISLAYQKSYEPANPSCIDMNVYIRDLISFLVDEHESEGRVECKMHLDCGLLPITSAVPLGLIINEALGNALQYAFPETADGRIEISFLCGAKEGNYSLSIEDNGVGLPEDFKIERTNSLGTSLMLGLSKQLKGELQLISDKGVLVAIEFSNLKPENKSS